MEQGGKGSENMERRLYGRERVRRSKGLARELQYKRFIFSVQKAGLDMLT